MGEELGNEASASTMPSAGLRDAARRIADLRHASVCFFGFAFLRAWDDMMISRFEGLFPASPWMGQDVFVLAMVPVFILCVLAGRRVLPLWDKKLLRMGAPALMLVSVVMLEMTLLAEGDPSVPAVVLCALPAGLGAALAILQWAELQSCLGSLQIVLYVSGSFFLGSVLGWLGLGLSGERLIVVLILLPLASALALKVGFAKIARRDQPRHQPGKLTFPWKLAIVLGVYEFVFGAKQATVGFSGNALIFGTMIAAVVLFVVAFFLSHRFDFTRIYRTPFVLMACGLLIALPTLPVAGVVADMLVATGYSFMFLMLTILLCDIAHRYGLSAALLCSIEELAMLAGIGGHWLSEVPSVGLSLDPTVVSVALVILVVLASMVLLSEREYSKWGVSFFGGSGLLREEDARARLVRRCGEVGEGYRLSPREKEVFALLAEGRTPEQIEHELYIANGTLKSHTRRIYQKLGIHSRAELQALIDEEPDGEESIDSGKLLDHFPTRAK